MKFIVDAQLPRRLARLLNQFGHDARHTLDLPLGNRTPDTVILQIAALEDRVVVTKDADFVNTFILDRKPKKLLLISTGNITNKELESILVLNLASIVAAFEDDDFVEITRKTLTSHP